MHKKNENQFWDGRWQISNVKNTRFLIDVRRLCTDLIRKLPAHSSATFSKSLPAKPQWTSCAQFGHSSPEPSGHFARWLSSRTERKLHGRLAGSMAHMWPASPAAERKWHVDGEPFSYSAEQTRSSHIEFVIPCKIKSRCWDIV